MLLVGSLTWKTVSRMTYTVLVETLNPAHSLTHSAWPVYVVLWLTAKGRTNVDLRDTVRPGTTQFMTHFRSKTPSKSVGELPDIHAWNRATSPTSAPIVKVVNWSVLTLLLDAHRKLYSLLFRILKHGYNQTGLRIGTFFPFLWVFFLHFFGFIICYCCCCC